MDDIVVRLRKWAISTQAVPASDLMDEAADEIERLRGTAPRVSTGHTGNQWFTIPDPPEKHND
jgi:hypothetical protein